MVAGRLAQLVRKRIPGVPVAACAVLLAGGSAASYAVSRTPASRAMGPAGAGHRVSSRGWHRVARRRSRAVGTYLEFGIYPGGAAGTVAPGGTVKPEDPAKRLAALEQLRPPGRRFFVRLYAAYYGPGGESAATQIGQELASYSDAGFDAELVLTYRPQDGGSPDAVRGFVDFTREAVRSLGRNAHLISLQVTNEANIGGAPNVADGSYVGAEDAMVQGIIGAKQEIRRAGMNQLKVGFNWAYVTQLSDRSFWSYIRQHGGRALVQALDWVGLDVYPGTWGPPLPAQSLGSGTGTWVKQALASLSSSMRAAGIPPGIRVHVSENGYPTGPGRTEAMQAASMEAAIGTIQKTRLEYNITSYGWFDLRDADSSSQSIETQYGLLRDDYSPKQAFGVYRRLVAAMSGASAARSRK